MTTDVPLRTEPESSFCVECGWPVQQCVCMNVEALDDEDDYSVCEHGVGLDEDCEECDAEDYDEQMGLGLP